MDLGTPSRPSVPLRCGVAPQALAAARASTRGGTGARTKRSKAHGTLQPGTKRLA